MANKPKKTRAAGSAGRGTAANAAKEKPISVQIVADIAEGTPAYYANFIEVSYTKWDFSLIMARIPAKHSAKKIIDMQSTGILSVTADVTINFPPTLAAALIRALTVQKEAYERETNAELKETSVQIVADIAEGTPAHYANFIEVIYTKWDFSLIMARIPAKHSAKKIIDLQSTGILSVTADVTITFPPTLAAALIRALTVQKEAYERETNAELKETGE